MNGNLGVVPRNRLRQKKIIGGAMMSVGLAAIVLVASFLWLLLLYPGIALILSIVSAVARFSKIPSQRLLDGVALWSSILLGSATISAVVYGCVIVTNAPATEERVRTLSILLYFLPPQFLWSRKNRQNSVATLIIALVVLGLATFAWVEAFDLF